MPGPENLESPTEKIDTLRPDEVSETPSSQSSKIPFEGIPHVEQREPISLSLDFPVEEEWDKSRRDATERRAFGTSRESIELFELDEAFANRAFRYDKEAGRIHLTLEGVKGDIIISRQTLEEAIAEINSRGGELPQSLSLFYGVLAKSKNPLQ